MDLDKVLDLDKALDVDMRRQLAATRMVERAGEADQAASMYTAAAERALKALTDLGEAEPGSLRVGGLKLSAAVLDKLGHHLMVYTFRLLRAARGYAELAGVKLVHGSHRRRMEQLGYPYTDEEWAETQEQVKGA